MTVVEFIIGGKIVGVADVRCLQFISKPKFKDEEGVHVSILGHYKNGYGSVCMSTVDYQLVDGLCIENTDYSFDELKTLKNYAGCKFWDYDKVFNSYLEACNQNKKITL